MSVMPLFDPKPVGPPSRDDMQAVMLDKAEAVRASGRGSAIIQAPTGFGKTWTAAQWILRGRKRGARTLFLAHRDILIGQTANDFRAAGITFAVEQAALNARGAMSLFSGVECVIGSKDTMQGRRLESWSPDRFTDIILDEVHLAASKTWRAVLAHFTGATFHLGLSATPFRLDGQPLYGTPDSLFGPCGHRAPYEMEGLNPGERVPDAIAFKYTLPVAIRNGHLADIVAVRCELGIDLKGLRISGKGKARDFNKGDIEARISSVVGPLANCVRQHLDRLGVKRAVAFTPEVGSAKALAEALSQVGIPATAVWTGSETHPMPEHEKKKRLEEYRHGRYRVIVSCDLLTLGWNDPETEAVILSRPTKSLGLALQMIGRGTRILPHKRKCYVLGFAWEGAEGVVSTLDILLEDEPDAKVRAKARQLAARQKDDRSALDLIDEARQLAADEEAEARRMEAARLRVKAKKQDVAHRFKQYTPFNVGPILGIDVAHDRKAARLNPSTPEQRAVCEALGLKGAAGLDRDSLQKVIDAELDRTFTKRATAEQVRRCIAAGLDPQTARGFTPAQAQEWLRLRDKPSPKLASWLRYQGYSPQQIDAMTRAEAGRIFGANQQRT